MSSSLSMAGKSNEAPVTVPVALRVPPELWVLVSEEFEYIDFKRLAGVCKAFKAIFEQPHYDLRLFSKPPTGQLQAGEALAIHPMLQKVDLFNCSDIIRAELLRFKGGNLIASDYPAADEFATTPACTKIKLEMDDRKCGTIRSPNDVRVRHVMNRAIKYWNAPATGNVALQIRREGGWPLGHLVTRSYALDEDCLFNGWDYAKVQVDGIAVVLASHPFG